MSLRTWRDPTSHQALSHGYVNTSTGPSLPDWISYAALDQAGTQVPKALDARPARSRPGEQTKQTRPTVAIWPAV